jgi:hypothetical protein
MEVIEIIQIIELIAFIAIRSMVGINWFASCIRARPKNPILNVIPDRDHFFSEII